MTFLKKSSDTKYNLPGVMSNAIPPCGQVPPPTPSVCWGVRRGNLKTYSRHIYDSRCRERKTVTRHTYISHCRERTTCWTVACHNQYTPPMAVLSMKSLWISGRRIKAVTSESLCDDRFFLWPYDEAIRTPGWREKTMPPSNSDNSSQDRRTGLRRSSRPARQTPT